LGGPTFKGREGGEKRRVREGRRVVTKGGARRKGTKGKGGEERGDEASPIEISGYATD